MLMHPDSAANYMQLENRRDSSIVLMKKEIVPRIEIVFIVSALRVKITPIN